MTIIQKNKKNAKSSERISIRCTKEEKQRITKVAKKRGITLKDCVINCVNNKENSMVIDEQNARNQLYFTASANTILSSIDEWMLLHGNNKELEELKENIESEVNKLWDYLPAR